MKAIWVMSTIILSLMMQHWLKEDHERKADLREKKKRLREEAIDKGMCYFLLPNFRQEYSSFWGY